MMTVTATGTKTGTITRSPWVSATGAGAISGMIMNTGTARIIMPPATHSIMDIITILITIHGPSIPGKLPIRRR